MNWIDISVGVSAGLPVWPGDPPIELAQIASIQAGDEANVSQLRAGVHIGTHVDAPRHFLDDGLTVEDLPLEAMIGPALVVDLPGVAVIDGQVLDEAGLPPGCERLLFKTANSQLWGQTSAGFSRDFVAIDASGASWLVERRVRLVAVDYLSVAPWGAAGPTHRTLLAAGIVILEGVDLRAAPPGNYTLVCLPLKLVGSDGAPARAVLGTAQALG